MSKLPANSGVTVGHFLDLGVWQQALKLLDHQIACQDRNRHFKTLSMIYYRKLGQAVGTLAKESYYKSRVASNMFYGLGQEFAAYPYVVPKRGLGLRKYTFLTYPMRALHYAVGLYLLRLSDDFLRNFYGRRQRLKAFYGGRLAFQKGELQLNRRAVYFKRYYTAFRNRVRAQTRVNTSRKSVLRLDIQNYYEEISVPRMLALLDQYVRPSQRHVHRFDVVTREQIAFFYSFLAGGGRGIPQSDNSIVSAFIGHLYHVFADLLIEKEILRDPGPTRDYQLIRYVDDTHLSLTFSDGTRARDQEHYAESLGARIADRLYFKLGLRLSPKTRLFRLSKKEDLDALIDDLKKVSPQYRMHDDKKDEAPDVKLDSIFDQLATLKSATIAPETLTHELEGEILKEVFDRRVEQLLDSPSVKTRIRKVFSRFDLGRVKEFPLPIMIVLLKDSATKKRFRKFLLGRTALTTGDVGLIVTYLCQVDFNDAALVSKLEEYQPLATIVTALKSPQLFSGHPGYFDLAWPKVSKICEIPHAIDQTRLRRFHERTGSHSIALNHLANEVQAVCHYLDPSAAALRDYTAESMGAFLASHNIPPDVCAGIRNLFDERNMNVVSHPRSHSIPVSGVSPDRYVSYRGAVGECLDLLL